jgi:hypothetical protein
MPKGRGSVNAAGVERLARVDREAKPGPTFIPGFTSFTLGYQSSAARWHATLTSPIGASAGTSLRQRSTA